jgi:MraZ protein
MSGSGIYTGNIAVTPDKLGRFSLPALLRKEVPITNAEKAGQKQIFISQHMTWPCLLAGGSAIRGQLDALIDQFEQRCIRRSLPFNEDDVRGRLSGAGEVVPMDESGRFTMPDNLVDLGELRGNIFYRGMIDHFEIWGTETLFAQTDPSFDVIKRQAEAAVRAMEKVAAEKAAKGSKGDRA